MNAPTKWPSMRIDLAGVAVLVAAAALFYWMGVRPVLSMRDRSRAQQAQLADQRHAAARMAQRAEDIKKTLARTRRDLDALAVHLEPAATVNSRISPLTALAAHHGLKIDEVQPAEPAYGKDYGSAPITLDGSGSFTAWAAFLHELSESFPDTSVDSFQLSNTSDTLVRPVQFRISLVWYVSPQPPAAAQK